MTDIERVMAALAKRLTPELAAGLIKGTHVVVPREPTKEMDLSGVVALVEIFQKEIENWERDHPEYIIDAAVEGCDDGTQIEVMPISYLMIMANSSIVRPFYKAMLKAAQGDL